MKVNFDNMRKQMVNNFNRLAELAELESCSASIGNELEEMRNHIGLFLCIYDPSMEDFSDMSHLDLREV